MNTASDPADDHPHPDALPPRTGRRTLVTGINGQDGSYLAETLLARGDEVFGMVRRSSSDSLGRLAHLRPHADDRDGRGPRLRLVYGDLADDSSLRRALSLARPDELYNLAAQSHVAVSFEMPEYSTEVNAVGVVRLLEVVRDLRLPCRFYQASSSEQFGEVAESPQTGSTPFRPRSPYAIAKVFAHQMVGNYREAYDLFAVGGILFNHESPRRGENFVTRKITRAAAAIARGRTQPLTLGNLDAGRDWGFAGDYADAMTRMLSDANASRRDYVIATGRTHTVRQFCEAAFRGVDRPLSWQGEGLSEVGLGPGGETLVTIDERFFRPTEVNALCGDASAARHDLGWTPQTSFEELVAMMTAADLRPRPPHADAAGEWPVV